MSNLWYLDSGSSRHMTGDLSLCTKFKELLLEMKKRYTLGYDFIPEENVIIVCVGLDI